MQHAHKNLICCLLAIEIADYEAKPIFDQVRVTQDFHNLLSDATVCATSHDLASIVGEDGALLVFLGDPESCFSTALAIREATLTQDRYRDLQLRTGIDLGKAHIAEDEFGRTHVSGEGRQDADRLMRQGPPCQISASRRFVELLSRSAPDLAEMLEYQGLYSDNVGSLHWYRAPAPQDSASEGLSDQPPTPALPADAIDTPMQSELAPVAVRSMAKFQDWLRRPRLGYALLLLVVGVAIVALSIRISVNPLSFKRAAQVVVVTPQTTAPQAPESLPRPAESLGGLAASLPAPAAVPEGTIGPAVTAPLELMKDPRASESAGTLLSEPIEEAAVAAPRVEQGAPDKVNSAGEREKKKHKRSKRESKNTPSEEPELPANGEATTDSMLTCARIEVLAKRLACFDKLKRGGTGQTGNPGKG